MSDAEFAEVMRKQAKQLLERFPGMTPMTGVADNRPISQEELERIQAGILALAVKVGENDAPTNVAEEGI